MGSVALCFIPPAALIHGAFSCFSGNPKGSQSWDDTIFKERKRVVVKTCLWLLFLFAFGSSLYLVPYVFM